MKPSLSVLLPVFNGQATIGPLVSQLLEVLPEMTPDFEILVIDDGSSDATGEVAHELAIRYPQVGVLTQPAPLGAMAAVYHGLNQTTGEWVLFREHNCPADFYELDKLWKPAHEYDMVHGVDSASGEDAGLQLFRRRVTRGWQSAVGEDTLLAYLRGTGYRMCQIPVRGPVAAVPGVRAIVPSRHQRLATPEPSRLDAGTRSVLRPKQSQRTHYLARLKAFAWGE